MLKRYFIITLSLVLALSFCACGKKDKNDAKDVDDKSISASKEANKDTQNNNSSNTSQSSGAINSDSKEDAEKFDAEESNLNKILTGDTYTIKTETQMDGYTQVSTAVRDGDNYYNDDVIGSNRSTVIIKGNTSYTLLHSQKQYLQEDISAFLGDQQEDEQYFEMSASEGEKVEYTKGIVKIDGQTYDYEEFYESDGYVKYCFSGDTLKYILKNDSNGNQIKMKIIEFSHKADKSIFNIPSGYQRLEY